MCRRRYFGIMHVFYFSLNSHPLLLAFIGILSIWFEFQKFSEQLFSLLCRIRLKWSRIFRQILSKEYHELGDPGKLSQMGPHEGDTIMNGSNKLLCPDAL